MVNRRIARGCRNKQKKKIRKIKKAHLSESLSHDKRKSGGLQRFTQDTIAQSIPSIPVLSSGRSLNHLKKSPTSASAAILSKLKKRKSLMLKRQAAERMVLKEHLRGLGTRRAATRRGENAKAERRELGKYIRQLKEEQRVKHASELRGVEAELTQLFEAKKQRRKSRLNEETLSILASDVDWEDLDEGDENFGGMDEKELQEMFSHLTA